MNSLLNKSGIDRRFSFWIVILLIGIISFIRLNDSRWAHKGNVGDTQLSFDSFGYYLYLPSAFIYHDFSQLEYLKDVLPAYKPTTDFSQAAEGPKGRYVNKYTIGQSIMFAPFFLIAHYLIVPFTEFSRDGFSHPYQLLISIGCLIYTIIGLLFLRKALNFYFDDRITASVLVLIVLGTNYMLYASRENTMPHNQLFALFAVILYLTSRFYQHPSFGRATLIGSLIGLCGLVRPTEVIICIIPVLWGVYTIPDFSHRIRNYWKHIGIMALTAFCVFSIQLMYWKLQSGSWLFYSYGNESLNFLNPHFFEVLFSFRKGLFVYTPVILFGFIGIILMFKKMNQHVIAIVSFAVLNLIIVSSWDCWWYGGSFGQRSMVQFYAIAAIPLAAFISFLIQQKNNLLKGLLGSVLVFLLVLNVFQVWQYKKGIIHYESMTKEAYISVFGKFSSPDNLSSLFKEPDYSHYRPAKNISNEEHMLINENFESGYFPGYGYEKSAGFRSDKTIQFSPTFTFPLKSLKFAPEVKIKCSFMAMSGKDISDSKLIMTVEADGKPAYIYKSLDLSMLKLTNSEWHPVEMWLDVPKYAGVNDVIKVYIWNQNDDELFIDNLQIVLLKKKFLM
ncbi:MAG: hypothetical protein KBH11_05995 [Bacteroidia bacterium]|nr:hypothetical protein [Bacteroidota bacterium]MBP9082606.1 hypothetical protein [Bacteroidia bacterium]